jgi:hypothetical protein
LLGLCISNRSLGLWTHAGLRWLGTNEGRLVLQCMHQFVSIPSLLIAYSCEQIHSGRSMHRSRSSEYDSIDPLISIKQVQIDRSNQWSRSSEYKSIDPINDLDQASTNWSIQSMISIKRVQIDRSIDLDRAKV